VNKGGCRTSLVTRGKSRYKEGGGGMEGAEGYVGTKKAKRKKRRGRFNHRGVGSACRDYQPGKSRERTKGRREK